MTTSFVASRVQPTTSDKIKNIDHKLISFFIVFSKCYEITLIFYRRRKEREVLKTIDKFLYPIF